MEVEDDTDEYWQLQLNQEAIWLYNLLREKIVEDWRKLNVAYKKKQKTICKQKQQYKKEQEKYWNPMRPRKKKEQHK